MEVLERGGGKEERGRGMEREEKGWKKRNKERRGGRTKVPGKG